MLTKMQLWVIVLAVAAFGVYAFVTESHSLVVRFYVWGMAGVAFMIALEYWNRMPRHHG